MAQALSALRSNLRTILQDVGTAGVYAYSDQSCDDLIRTVIQTGIGPAGVGLNDALDALDPEPSTPDARGYLVLKAALLAIGGTTGFNWKTRSMTVTMNPMERKHTLDHLRRTIAKLEADGDPHGTGLSSGVFGVWEDYENYIFRFTERERTY